MPIWVQAQSWLGNESVTVTNTGMDTYHESQRVKSYGNDYLIGVSRKRSAEHYCFTAWKDGNNYIICGMLQDAGYIVSDFAFVGDTAYFCGKRQMSSTTTVGIIGTFLVQDLISGNIFNYGVTDIANTSEITKLEAYKSLAEPTVTHIVATGILANPNPFSGCFVYLNDRTSSAFDCSIFTIPNMVGVYEEKLVDIAVTDDYVATLSFINPIDHFVIRRYDKKYPDNTAYHASYLYDFSSVLYATPIMPSKPSMCMTNLNGNYVVVGSPAIGLNNDNFTLLNFIKLETMGTIVSNQIVPHVDKMMMLYDMEFSPSTDRLLLLENSNLHNDGSWNQSITHILPYTPTPYQTRTWYLTTPSYLDDISIIQNDKYAVAGVDKSSNNYPLLFTKEITNTDEICAKTYQPKVDAMSLGTTSQYNHVLSQSIAFLNWSIRQMGANNMPLNLDCLHQ